MNKAPSVAGPTRRRGSSETVPPVPLGIRRRIRPSAISHTARPMSVPRVDLPTTAMTSGSADTSSAPRTPKLLPTPINASDDDGPTHRRDRKKAMTSNRSERARAAGTQCQSHSSIFAPSILIRDIQISNCKR